MNRTRLCFIRSADRYIHIWFWLPVCEGIPDRCNSLDESREARQTHFERRRPRWPDNIDCLMIHSHSTSTSCRPRWPDNIDSMKLSVAFLAFTRQKSWTMLVSVWCGVHCGQLATCTKVPGSWCHLTKWEECFLLFERTEKVVGRYYWVVGN